MIKHGWMRIGNIYNQIALNKMHANALNSTFSIEEKKNVEKLFVLPNENYEFVDYRDFGVVNENTNNIPHFIIGEKYMLQGVACDGFEMPSKTYELIGIVDEFHGVEVNYVIMKQISGEKGLIYTLSKNDCIHLNIEYQEGLQPFPKNLNWKHLKEDTVFDCRDLSTAPKSDIDNTIRYLLIRMNGFKDYSNGYILSPSGKLIKESDFINSLRVINNEPIVYGNGAILREKTRIMSEIVYPKKLMFPYGNFISQDETIYLKISLLQRQSTPQETYIDGYFGVEPKYLGTINPHKLFTIAWNELCCLTIDEYKEQEEKIQREQLIEIARIEKAKKQKQLEAMKRRNASKIAIQNLIDNGSCDISRFLTLHLNDVGVIENIIGEVDARISKISEQLNSAFLF